MTDEEKKYRGLSMASCVNMSGTSITVTATSPDIEQELNYPADIPKEQLISSLSYELGPHFKPVMIEKIVETVENEGLRFDGVEIGATIEEGFKFKINFSPKKTIKTFFKVKGDE